MGMFVLSLIILPLMSSIIGFILRNEKVYARISTYITFLTLIVSTILLIGREHGVIELYGILEIYPDRLGLLLSTYILLVSLVIHRYSQNYMNEDPGYRRFFILLDLTTTNLILLVLAGNLLLLFSAWHFMGVLLYLLLNHNYESRSANRFANISLFTHRLADVPLLIAIVLIVYEFRTLRIYEINETVMSGNFESTYMGLVTVLIVLSAILKSAQMPFHIWLVYSMEGPTPVSAFMHAGIVNAGAFLVNRFAPLFLYDTYGLHLAFLVGSLTAILGSALMLVQSDVKKALGYSTVGQMGYMIMEIGIGAFALAIYHMMAHGVFKATLFLYSGNVIHGARKDPNIPEDEFYTAITKGREISYRVPWIFYGILTAVIPLLIFLLTHLIVEEKFLEYKTSLILLFFGWITGAQVLISTFRVGRERPFLTATMAVFSLLVFLLGYVTLGHGLKVFLYPNEDLMESIYHKSFAENPLFYLELIFMTLLIIFGWIFMYYSGKNKYLQVHTSMYAHLSKELYILDLYYLAKDVFNKLARKLSVLSVSSAVAGSFGFAILGLEVSEVPVIVLASLFIPLFPVSLFTIVLLKKAGILLYILFPLVGILFVGMVDVPFIIKILASLTYIFHSIRIFVSRNLSVFSQELYCALLSLIWLFDKKDLVFGLFLAASPVVVVVLERMLKKRFGTSEFTALGGLAKKMPMFSTIALISLLYVSATPLFPTFLAFYESILGESYLITVLTTSGWLLLGLGTAVSAGKLFVGKARDDIFYKDLKSKEMLVIGIPLLLFALSGFLYTAEV